MRLAVMDASCKVLWSHGFVQDRSDVLACWHSHVSRFAGGEAKSLQPLNRTPADSAGERPEKRPKVRPCFHASRPLAVLS